MNVAERRRAGKSIQVLPIGFFHIVWRKCARRIKMPSRHDEGAQNRFAASLMKAWDDMIRLKMTGSTPLTGGATWCRTARILAATGLLLIAFFLTGDSPVSVLAADPATGIDSARLYNLTNVWTVHLKFAPSQWEAMEPKGGLGFFGGLFGGGAQGGPGGPGGFSLANMLAPAFLRQGDVNRDGRLSRSEFAGLAKKWFAAWDTNKTGKLGEDQIRAGLNGIRVPNGFGFGLMLQGPEGKRNGLASAMGIDFVYVHADLEVAGGRSKTWGFATRATAPSWNRAVPSNAR
jgi:hypothetical protein